MVEVSPLIMKAILIMFKNKNNQEIISISIRNYNEIILAATSKITIGFTALKNLFK